MRAINIKSWQLARYSAFALSYLQMSQSGDAQVIYTDINPDIILDSAGEYGFVNMDNNGDLDFGFLNSSFVIYEWLDGIYMKREDIIALTFTNNKSIMGSVLRQDLGYYYLTTYFPDALSQGVLIQGDEIFQNNYVQVMGLVDFSIYGLYTSQCGHCDWYGYANPETIDKYMGVRFVDADSLLHYGWIRCDVIDSGRTIIVKDYAYELQPDFPIAAGSKTSYADVAIKRPLVAEIYSNGNIIYINITERPTEEYEIHIYGLNGQSLFYEKRTETFNVITVDLPKGIYLVEVESGSKKVSENVYVN